MKKILSLLLVFILFLATNNAVTAASALDLKVYPPTAYLSVKPGAGINHQIKLKNDGLYTLEITPSLVNFHSDEKTGRAVLEQNSDFSYLNLDGDPGKWNQSFLIKPGEEEALNFVIALPSDAEYAEHHLSILFQAKQVFYSDDASNNNKDSLVSAIVASNVVLVVNADEQNRGELTIEQFFLPKIADSFMGFDFSAMVRNIGINATPIDGYIKISHWPEQQVDVYQLYPDMVLADDKRLVRTMSENDLKTLEDMEKNKEVTIAAGGDFDSLKEAFIDQHLLTRVFYKKGFMIGAYDLELKVGDDILQKRVIVLPFSILLIAILLPVIYFFFHLLSKFLNKPVDLKN